MHWCSLQYMHLHYL